MQVDPSGNSTLILLLQTIIIPSRRLVRIGQRAPPDPISLIVQLEHSN